jgi:hypothetical protein
MKSKVIVALFFMLGLASAMFAQTGTPGVKTPGINERQKDQQERIGQGVKSGELTAKETARLERQQHRIQRDKRQAKADGTVTKAERAEIRARQNNASRNIAHQKHDGQGRHH